MIPLTFMGPQFGGVPTGTGGFVEGGDRDLDRTVGPLTGRPTTARAYISRSGPPCRPCNGTLFPQRAAGSRAAVDERLRWTVIAGHQVITSRKRKLLVILPATLPPPKDRAGVVYDHRRRQITAKQPAAPEALARRRAKAAKKRAS